MNITEKVAKYFGGELGQIIHNNKEIQFYFCDTHYVWCDRRFMKSADEFKNKTALDYDHLKDVFSEHINSITKEYLEETKNKLIQKYIGEFNKPSTYHTELRYLNAKLDTLCNFDKRDKVYPATNADTKRYSEWVDKMKLKLKAYKEASDLGFFICWGLSKSLFIEIKGSAAMSSDDRDVSII